MENGQSKGQTMARFMYLEKRFMRDDGLRREYTKVMEEYIQLGHMRDTSHLPDTAK